MKDIWTFRFTAILALLCSIGLLTGCDSAEDEDEFEDLQGLWSLVEVDSDGEVTEFDDELFLHVEGNDATIYVFVQGDGETFEDCYFIFSEEIEQDGDGFTIPDDEGGTDNVDITFSGNQMIVHSDDGETEETSTWQRSSVNVNTLTPECDFNFE